MRLDVRHEPEPRAPLVADAARELRREMVAHAKTLVRRKTSFVGWLDCWALARHELTRCGCGLINCR